MIHKFRGWHKTKKIMFSPEKLGKDQLTISADGRGFINVSGQSQGLSEFMTHIIPLQFTGLTDKNDRDIFAGDIIEFTIYPDNAEPIKIKEFVTFSSGCFALNNSGLLFPKMPHVEIIGNIYENPELVRDES